METRNRFIAPERMGAWLVVTLGTALAALVISVWGIMESRTTATVLQVEILKFNERVRSLEQAPKAAMPAMPAPAEAMPAPMPAESK